MKKLFVAYRVLAYVVGVLLAFCTVALLLKYLTPDGSAVQRFGESASIMWAVHGWVFIVYVVVAFFLSRRAEWTLAFTGVVLVAGLVPLTIFFVEHAVASRLRAEWPEELDLEPTAKAPA